MTRLALVLAVPLTLGIILPAPVVSGEGPTAALVNSSFDKDVKGWTASPGAQASHDPGEGDPKPGALKGVSDAQGSLTIVGPCVKVRPSTAYRLDGRLRSAKGTAFFCTLNAFQFSDSTCTQGQEPLGSAAKPPEAKWTPVSGTATTHAEAGSVRIHPVCSGEPGFAVLWDSISFQR